MRVQARVALRSPWGANSARNRLAQEPPQMSGLMRMRLASGLKGENDATSHIGCGDGIGRVCDGAGPGDAGRAAWGRGAAITLVAGGCGIGFHRGPYGGCRPNGYYGGGAVVVGAPAYRYGYGAHGVYGVHGGYGYHYGYHHYGYHRGYHGGYHGRGYNYHYR